MTAVKRWGRGMVTGVLLCLLLLLMAVPALAAPAGEQPPSVQQLAAAGEHPVEEVSAVPVTALTVVGVLALGCVGMAVYKTASKS